MKTITIPDPAEVGAMLDRELPPQVAAVFHEPGCHADEGGAYWKCLHWVSGSDCIRGYGDTPQSLLADIRAKIAAHDPLAKLRKEWIAAGRPTLD